MPCEHSGHSCSEKVHSGQKGVTEEEDVVSADKLVVTGEEIVILKLYLVMRNVRHRWWAPGKLEYGSPGASHVTQGEFVQ